MRPTLTFDATLTDVLPTLSSPEEYVRVILSSLYDCRCDCGEPEVRLGITGEGKAPYYRVDYVDEKTGERRLFGSFASSKAGQGIVTHEKTWSNRSMTLDQVAEVLGQLRASR